MGRTAVSLQGTRTVTFKSECVSKGEPEHTKFSNPAGITINDNATATPYPSTISVSGLTGVVSRVRVTLKGLTHTFPNDIDMLLVGPTGQSLKFMSDTGGTTAPLSPVTITFDDTAAGGIPGAGPLTSGFFRPTEFNAGDGFPAPAPTPSSAAALSIFHGTDPNGTWSLFIVDDLGEDVGVISGGWSIDLVMAKQVCAPGPIVINDFATATPYPASVMVSGLTGQVVSKLTVTLNGLTHTFPADIDVLLVGPQGQDSILMSDPGISAGNSPPVNGLTITLDDDAATEVISPVPLVSGTFRPGNNDPGDVLPPPAPVPSGGTALSTFNGTDPNGSWRLFVRDDGPPDTGMISGYCLNITTVAPSPDCNPASITIPAGAPETSSGPAAPLLVGPGGQNALVMSDAGGGADVNNVNLVLDDASAASLPDATQIVSGAFKPTNFDTVDVLPAPAPAGPYADPPLLSAFNGTDPNGTWSLFVFDDEGGGVGSLASWCLEILPPALPPGDMVLSWAAGTTDTLEWTPGPRASSYNVYRGFPFNLPNLLTCYKDSSLRVATAGTGSTLAEIPAPGTMFWYLVRSVNATGEGPAGDARIGGFDTARLQSTVGQCTCAHDKCSQGAALSPSCEPCVDQLCQLDSFCCSTMWDGFCVDEVRTICGSLACTVAACVHGPCQPGGPLAAGCDDPPVSPSCVSAVCGVDAACCTFGWDALCVAEVSMICGFSCD